MVDILVGMDILVEVDILAEVDSLAEADSGQCLGSNQGCLGEVVGCSSEDCLVDCLVGDYTVDPGSNIRNPGCCMP